MKLCNHVFVLMASVGPGGVWHTQRSAIAPQSACQHLRSETASEDPLACPCTRTPGIGRERRGRGVIAVGEENLHERPAYTALSLAASGTRAWADTRIMRICLLSEKLACTMRWVM